MNKPRVSRPSGKGSGIDWTRYGFKRAPRDRFVRAEIMHFDAAADTPPPFYLDVLRRVESAKKDNADSGDGTET